MKLQQIDLHNKTLDEALELVRKNITWMISHELKGLVFIHGKGMHSNRVAVLKQEVRRFLETNDELKDEGYLVVKGEEAYGITDTLNEGHVVVIQKGFENESSADGESQREKAYIVHSEEGRELRKQCKKNRKSKKHQNKVVFYEKPSPVTIDSKRFFENSTAMENTGKSWPSRVYISDVLTDRMEFLGVESIVVGIGSWYIDVIPANTQFVKAGQLKYKNMALLSAETKSVNLLNAELNKLPSIYRITDDSFFLFDTKDCQIGSIVLTYKCGKESDIRTIMLLKDPSSED